MPLGSDYSFGTERVGGRPVSSALSLAPVAWRWGRFAQRESLSSCRARLCEIPLLVL